jgi:hypothetical protein
MLYLSGIRITELKILRLSYKIMITYRIEKNFREANNRFATQEIP